MRDSVKFWKEGGGVGFQGSSSEGVRVWASRVNRLGHGSPRQRGEGQSTCFTPRSSDLPWVQVR